MVVTKGPKPKTLYNNMDDNNLPFTGCNDLQYFKDKLFELKIDAPETVFEEVMKDCINNTGNREVNHDLLMH